MKTRMSQRQESSTSALKALMVGGDPAYSVYQRLSANLRETFNIEVIQHWGGRASRMKSDIDVVLISTDMCRQDLSNKAMTEARARSIPYVTIARKWATTKTMLEIRGFEQVEPSRITKHEEEEEEDMKKKSQKKPPTSTEAAATARATASVVPLQHTPPQPWIGPKERALLVELMACCREKGIQSLIIDPEGSVAEWERRCVTQGTLSHHQLENEGDVYDLSTNWERCWVTQGKITLG